MGKHQGELRNNLPIKPDRRYSSSTEMKNPADYVYEICESVIYNYTTTTAAALEHVLDELDALKRNQYGEETTARNSGEESPSPARKLRRKR